MHGSFNMHAFTLLVTVALAAVINVAADSKSHESYGDDSKMRNSNYHDYDNYQPHDHDHDHDSHSSHHDHHHHHHDHSSHGPDFDHHKTLVTRSLLPEMDQAADEFQAQIPDVDAEISTPLSDVSDGAAAFAEEVMQESPLNDDPIAEGAALAGLTENSSPIDSRPYMYQRDPYQGYPPPPPAPQYLPPQSQYLPPQSQYLPPQSQYPRPPVYERYPSPYAPRYQQYTPPPPTPNSYRPPPPPSNHYGPPPPRYIPA